MYVSRSCSCNAFAESACSSVLGQSRFYTSPSLRLCSFHYFSMTSVFFGSYRANKDNRTHPSGWHSSLCLSLCHQETSLNFNVYTWIFLILILCILQKHSCHLPSCNTLKWFEMAPCLPRWEAPRLLLLPALLPTSAQLRPFPCST